MANYKSGSRLCTSAGSNLAVQRSASIHAAASSNTSSFPSMQMPPTVRIETSEPYANIDGLPLLVPFLVKDLLSTRDGSIPKNADAQTLLSIVLERMATRMRGMLAPMGDLGHSCDAYGRCQRRCLETALRQIWPAERDGCRRTRTRTPQ